MVKRVSECVHCSVCVGCSLKAKYNAMFCDRCKNEIQTGDRVYFVEGEDLCMDCALDALESEEVTEEALDE